MKANQIRWARDHDWYINHTPTGKVIVVERTYSSASKELEEKIRVFDDYQELREWAGY